MEELDAVGKVHDADDGGKVGRTGRRCADTAIGDGSPPGRPEGRRHQPWAAHAPGGT